MGAIVIILFESSERRLWLKQISDIYSRYSKKVVNTKAVIDFSDSIHVDSIKPFVKNG